MQTFDYQLNVVADSGQSLLAQIGRWIAPIFAPLGFGEWRVSTALITGFTAKEAVVSTLAVLTGTSMDGLGQVLGGLFTPLSALSFLIFIGKRQDIGQVCCTLIAHTRIVALQQGYEFIGQIDVETGLRKAAALCTGNDITVAVRYTAITGTAGVDGNISRRDGEGVGPYLYRGSNLLNRIIRCIRRRNNHGVYILTVLA